MYCVQHACSKDIGCIGAVIFADRITAVSIPLLPQNIFLYSVAHSEQKCDKIFLFFISNLFFIYLKYLYCIYYKYVEYDFICKLLQKN